MTTRVLVIDDSPTLRKIVSLSFSGEDAVVEGTGNADEALDFVRTWSPDVVLADAQLPGLSGYELCRRIKGDPAFSRTPVILLTGAFDLFDETEAAAAGCDGKLAKPLDSSELVRLVQSLVSRPPAGHGTSDKKVAAERGRHFASSRTLESFLGSGRVLDLLDPLVLKRQAPKPPEPAAPAQPAAQAESPAPRGADTAEATAPAGENESTLDQRIEEKIRTLAPAILRELAEQIVRETLRGVMDDRSPEPRG